MLHRSGKQEACTPSCVEESTPPGARCCSASATTCAQRPGRSSALPVPSRRLCLSRPFRKAALACLLCTGSALGTATDQRPAPRCTARGGSAPTRRAAGSRATRRALRQLQPAASRSLPHSCALPLILTQRMDTLGRRAASDERAWPGRRAEMRAPRLRSPSAATSRISRASRPRSQMSSSWLKLVRALRRARAPRLRRGQPPCSGAAAEAAGGRPDAGSGGWSSRPASGPPSAWMGMAGAAIRQAPPHPHNGEDDPSARIRSRCARAGARTARPRRAWRGGRSSARPRPRRRSWRSPCACRGS